MIRPLTKDERRLWSQGTEDIATNARDFVSAEVLAMNRQRYESTLQAKDAQIEKLVIACTHLLLSADVVWEQGEQGHDWPEACKEARAAIKEATQ